MDRATLIINLVEAGFEQKVDRSEGAVNKKGEPLVSYSKKIEGGDLLSVEFRRSGPGERYNCCRYTPLIDDEFPDEPWDGTMVHAGGAQQSPATVDGKHFDQWGSTAEQVITFLEANGGFDPVVNDGVDYESVTFKKGDWQYTKDMGNDGLGRLDTILDVKGHPKYDGIRFFWFPGGGGEIIEWMKDGEHYDNNQAPIPKVVRERVMEKIIEDLRTRLNTIDW